MIHIKKVAISFLVCLNVTILASCNLANNLEKEDPPVLPEETQQELRNKKIVGDFRTVVIGDDNTFFCRLDTLNFDDTKDFTLERELSSSTDGMIEEGPYALAEDGVLSLTDRLDPAGNMDNKAKIIALTATDTASWAKQLMVGIRINDSSSPASSKTFKGNYRISRLEVISGDVSASESQFAFNGEGNITIGQSADQVYMSYLVESTGEMILGGGTWHGAADPDGYFFVLAYTKNAYNCGIMIGIKEDEDSYTSQYEGKYTVSTIDLSGDISSERTLWEVEDEVKVLISTLSNSNGTNSEEKEFAYTLTKETGRLEVDGKGTGQFSKSAGIFAFIGESSPSISIGIRRY